MSPSLHKSCRSMHLVICPLPLWQRVVQKDPDDLHVQWECFAQSPLQWQMQPTASSSHASWSDNFSLNPSTSVSICTISAFKCSLYFRSCLSKLPIKYPCLAATEYLLVWWPLTIPVISTGKYGKYFVWRKFKYIW